MSRKKYLFIELLRAIGLLCVILFHTIGMLREKIPAATCSTMDYMAYASSLLVGIAVPMFMLISGYLYKAPLGVYEIRSFLRKKILRLLLPYCIFTILIMVTSGYFEFKQIYGGGFMHLWFLTALFWCFCVSLWINCSSQYYIFIFLAALFCSLLSLPDLLGIQNFVHFYCFFVLGIIIRENADFNLFKKYYLWFPLLLFYILANSLLPFRYRTPSIIHTLAISSILIVIWYSLRNIEIHKGQKIILNIGKYSLGIYILHFWILIYALSNTSLRIFHIPTLIQKFPIMTVCFIVMIVFFISYIGIGLLHRSKWGRFIIGS